MNNSLFDEIRKLQQRYREVLVKAKENIFKTNSKNVIDEVNCFWFQNRRVVKMILRNMCNPGEGYIFTGATVLDMSILDHFRFVSIGKYHIWDDPICSYMNTLNHNPSEQFEKRIKGEIISAIDNNIRLLDETDCKIIILPVRLVHETDMKKYENAESMFLSLFEGKIESVEDYRNSFTSIEEVNNALVERARRCVVFCDDEDPSKDMVVRFYESKEKISLPFSLNTDADRFYIQVVCNLTQAFDIVALSYVYCMIPFVRTDVTMKYCIFFYSHIPEFEITLIRTWICHILYRTFKKEMFQNVSFNDYCNCLGKYGFEEKVFRDIGVENLRLSNFSISETRAVIDSHLENLFSFLTTSP